MNTEFLAKGDFVYRHKNPPIIVKGEGVVLEDINGNRYLDLEAANGTSNLGFDSSIVEQAFEKSKNIPSIPSFSETDLRIEYAEKIGTKINNELGIKGKVAFEIGGAQGVELALKVVKKNSNKSQVVVFEGGYHGRSAYTSQFSASHRYRAINGDWRIPICRLPYPDCEQCRFEKRRSSCNLECISYLKSLFKSEVTGVVRNDGECDISAFILEPVLNAGGVVIPDKEYLKTAVDMLKSMGALIVVDEIFTGFYRTGKFLALQHYDIKPDIVIMSKAIVNGCTPFSCVWAREELMDIEKFTPGTHSATYVNNTLGVSVANTVLQRYENWTTCEEDVKNLEARMKDIINDIAGKFSIIESGNVIGGFGRLLLKKNVAKDIVDLATTISIDDPIDGYAGAILASTGLTPNIIAFNPALNISNSDLDSMRKIMLKTFENYEKLYS